MNSLIIEYMQQPSFRNEDNTDRAAHQAENHATMLPPGVKNTKPTYASAGSGRIVLGMQSSDLKPWQARALKNKLGPMLGYLNRLKRRMHRKGFAPGDPLLEAVTKAEAAVHELHVQTHYLSCPDSTGGPASAKPR